MKTKAGRNGGVPAREEKEGVKEERKRKSLNCRRGRRKGAQGSGKSPNKTTVL